MKNLLKSIFILFGLSVLSINVTAQKIALDSSTISHWYSLKVNPHISNNGKYFKYEVDNLPYKSSSAIIGSTDKMWADTISGDISGFFSKDSKQFIYLKNDTLFFLQNGSHHREHISPVLAYTVLNGGQSDWISYEENGATKNAVILNTITKQKIIFEKITSYWIDSQGKFIIFSRNDGGNNSNGESLYYCKILTGKPMLIWKSSKGNSIENLSGLSINNDKAIFMVREKTNSNTINSIWYYKDGMSHANLKVTNNSPGMRLGQIISESSPSFSNDGRYIYFQIEDQVQLIKDPSLSNVNIWSSSDTLLQSTQHYEFENRKFRCVNSIMSDSICQITHDYENISLYSPKGDYVILTNNYAGDRFWLDKGMRKNYLVSLKNSERILLDIGPYAFMHFSPDGKYLIAFSAETNSSYLSMELSTKKWKNISFNVPKGEFARKSLFEHDPTKVVVDCIGIAGWLGNNKEFLAYGNYDIWKLDATGRKSPINITENFGKKSHSKLRIINTEDILKFQTLKEEPLIISSFCNETKYNAIYTYTSKKGDKLRKCLDGPYTYFVIPGGAGNIEVAHEFDFGLKPLKAKNANAWLIQRQSSLEAANLFITSDFKKLTKLTDINPIKNVQWLSVDLINWKLNDSITNYGILYKPENFDSTKKYPVIVNYYTQYSNRINQFPHLGYASSAINIPWFVSHGYLVFTPDIHYFNSDIGPSALASVVSGVESISMLSYIDKSKVGIVGHSYGGSETFYIATHSNLFACALAGAGASDAISSSLALTKAAYQETSRLGQAEASHSGTIWNNQRKYLEQSPILFADKVTCPMLLFHSKKDEAMPWEQALEFFIAMRRLGKPAWILEYENANHNVEGLDAVDYTLRTLQYFNHYLMGKPAPYWMTQGIPARLKGISDGLTLDISGRIPGPTEK